MSDTHGFREIGLTVLGFIALLVALACIMLGVLGLVDGDSAWGGGFGAALIGGALLLCSGGSSGD